MTDMFKPKFWLSLFLTTFLTLMVIGVIKKFTKDVPVVGDVMQEV